MSQATNTFSSYDAVGNREDLIDVITNISPTDTWFTSNSGNTRSLSTTHEWQTDALATPGANAQIEGDDSPSATAVSPTVRLTNPTQIIRKVFLVSGTQDAVNKAGRGEETPYQMTKNLKELANDMEYAFLINASAVTGDDSTARQTKGALGFISTNVTTGTGTGNEALTEDMLNDNLQEIWAQGGRPSHVLCGGKQKRVISNFSTNTREVSAEKEKLVRSVDVYKSDFGELMIHPSTIMNTNAAGTVIVFGDMSLWNKAFLRPVVREQLAKTGDARKFQLIAEVALECRQEKGSGKITQLSTT